MGIAPDFQRRNHRLHGVAKRCQRVVHAWWHHREDGARNQARLFQFAQLLGQHALGDAWDVATQLVEAQRALVDEVIKDHTLPFSIKET